MKTRKLLSLLLSVIMILSLVPTFAFADEEGSSETDQGVEELAVDLMGEVHVTAFPEEYMLLGKKTTEMALLKLVEIEVPGAIQVEKTKGEDGSYTFTVTGTSYYLSDYTGFSGDAALQKGWYFPFAVYNPISAANELLKDENVTITRVSYDPGDFERASWFTTGSDDSAVAMRVSPTEGTGVKELTVKWWAAEQCVKTDTVKIDYTGLTLAVKEGVTAPIGGAVQSWATDNFVLLGKGAKLTGEDANLKELNVKDGWYEAGKWQFVEPTEISAASDAKVALDTAVENATGELTLTSTHAAGTVFKLYADNEGNKGSEASDWTAVLKEDEENAVVTVTYTGTGELPAETKLWITADADGEEGQAYVESATAAAFTAKAAQTAAPAKENASVAFSNKDGKAVITLTNAGDTAIAAGATWAVYEQDGDENKPLKTPSNTWTVSVADNKLTISSGTKPNAAVKLWVTAKETGKLESAPLAVTLGADALAQPTATKTGVKVTDDAGNTEIELTLSDNNADFGAFYDVYKAADLTDATPIAEDVEPDSDNKLTFTVPDSAYNDTALTVYLVAKKTGKADSPVSEGIEANRTATGVTVENSAVTVNAADNTNKTGTATITTAANMEYRVYANKGDKTVVEGVTVAYATNTTLSFASETAISASTDYWVVARAEDAAPVWFKLTFTPKNAATAPAFDTTTSFAGETSGTVTVYLTNTYRTSAFTTEGITDYNGFTVYAGETATTPATAEVAAFTAYNNGALTLALGANAFAEATTLDLWITAKSDSYAESARTKITVTQTQSAALELAAEQGENDGTFVSADDKDFTVTLKSAPAAGVLALYTKDGETYTKVDTASIEASGTAVTVTFKDAALATASGVFYLTNTETNKAESAYLQIEVTGYAMEDTAALTNFTLKYGSSYGDIATTAADNDDKTIQTATVANTVTSVKITPTLKGTGAYVMLGEERLSSGTASSPITLQNVGNKTNDVEAKLYAENGTLIETYTIKITRAAAEGDAVAAKLSGITIAGGTLAPEFNAETTAYTVALGATATSVTVTAAANTSDTNGVVTMGTDAEKLAVVSGNALTVSFDKAETKTVSIKVVSSTGDEKTYTVALTRAASDDDTLAAETPIKLYTDEAYSAGVVNAEVDSTDATKYTASATAHGAQTLYVAVEVKDDNAAVTAILGQAAEQDADNKKLYKAPVTLADGANTIPIVVKAENGDEKTYTLAVTVTPKGSDATLRALDILTGNGNQTKTIDTSFDANKTSYTVEVAETDKQYGFKVAATATDGNANVDVDVAYADGTKIEPETEVYKITPSGASTTATVTVTVTAEDGAAKRTYTVTVVQAGKKNIATLDSLKVVTTDSDGNDTAVSASKLNFSAAKTEYTLTVASDVASLKVTPTVTENSEAAVTVRGKVVISGAASGAINLKTGENEIEIVVTAQDETTKQTYKLTVTKAEASKITTLASVTAGGKKVDPAEGTALTLDSITVAEDATTYAVSAAATDSKAHVAINAQPTATDANSAKADVARANNVVTINVMAEDGTVAAYTLTIGTITVLNSESTYAGEEAVAAAAETTTETSDDGTVTAAVTVDESAAVNIGADTGSVTVSATGTDADATNVTLPAAVVEALAQTANDQADAANEKDIFVTVETDVANVTLSSEALQTIAEGAKAGSGTASIDVAKPVWSDPAKPKVVAAVAAAIAESDPNGTGEGLAATTIETFSVAVTDSSGKEIAIKELEKPIALTFKTSVNNPIIFYLDTRGSVAVLRQVAGQQADGTSVTFTSKHLSDYVALDGEKLTGVKKYSDGLTVPAGETANGVVSFTIDGYALDHFVTVQTEYGEKFSFTTFSGMGPSFGVSGAAGAKISVWETEETIQISDKGAVSNKPVASVINQG